MKMPHTRAFVGLVMVTVISGILSGGSRVFGQSESSRPPSGISRRLNPAPSCFDNTNRYVNCGNGTVTDTTTGLIWLQDAGCLGPLTWAEANEAAATLKEGRCGLMDRSRPGDWRLPTNTEWKAMVDAAANHPLLRCTNPTLTDDSGSACFGSGGGSSFANVTVAGYWSSTTNSQSVGLLPSGVSAGQMNLANGFLASLFHKSCCPQRAWPVRAS
jgi:hypothetical protein